jgi:acetyl-CoA acetyltransferase
MAEALIIDAVRTPMGRYRGALAGVRPDDLAAHAIAAAVARTRIDPAQVGDVYWELRRRGGRYGIASLCVGVGRGVATVIERV